MGEIETTAHTLTTNGQVEYRSGPSFFENTASREKFKSSRFLELALDFAAGTSNRKAPARLNRIRLEPDGIGTTTYRNTVEREGAALQRKIEQKCDETLISNGFGNNGEMLEGTSFTPNKQRHIEQAAIEDAAIELNIWNYKAEDYELGTETVNVSIDNVSVNRQTETRPKDDNVIQPKRVDNTVIHIESRNKSYILNAASLIGSLKLLIGLLLFNGLLGKQIVVFSDGARNIHNAVLKMLSFANVKIILDWYHLKKKCQEQLSMALKGSKIRNEFLNLLLPCLWFGNIKGAIKLLHDIDPKKIKNCDYITKLIEYFQRIQEYVPCYALRKELGLRNSSNLGEKSNDIVVSNRQKHNGMSWSDDGSVAFATVAAAAYNHEVNRWIYNREVSLELCELEQAA